MKSIEKINKSDFEAMYNQEKELNETLNKKLNEISKRNKELEDLVMNMQGEISNYIIKYMNVLEELIYYQREVIKNSISKG